MAEEVKKYIPKKIKVSIVSIVAVLSVAGLILYFQYFGMVSAKAGDTVSVDYVGTLENGTVFDTSMQSVAAENNMLDPQRPYQPLQFTIGSGSLIKGFDNAVVGMKVGETKDIKLNPGEAYGEIKSGLIVSVNASRIQTEGEELKVGSEVFLETGATGKVIKIENGNATIDFNHPLAGQILNFKITLVKIGSN